MTKYFELFVTTVLLVFAGIFKSPAFAYASVLSLMASLFREAVQNKIFALKDIKVSIPDDVKKKLQELESRVTTAEYQMSNSGFFPNKMR